MKISVVAVALCVLLIAQAKAEAVDPRTIDIGTLPSAAAVCNGAVLPESHLDMTLAFFDKPPPRSFDVSFGLGERVDGAMFAKNGRMWENFVDLGTTVSSERLGHETTHCDRVVSAFKVHQKDADHLLVEFRIDRAHDGLNISCHDVIVARFGEVASTPCPFFGAKTQMYFKGEPAK